MKKIPPSMPKYPAAVQYLLQSFATEGVISAACQRVSTAKQLPEEDEKSFANRLDKYAAEAGCVFSEDALISAFVDGLLPYAGSTVRGQVTPQMTFAEVQILAENVGAAGRSLMTPGRSQIRWSIVGSVRAVRSYRVKRVKIMMPWSLECYSSKAERELFTTKMRARRRRCKMIVPRFGLT
jgi:hypothetical protein